MDKILDLVEKIPNLGNDNNSFLHNNPHIVDHLEEIVRLHSTNNRVMEILPELVLLTRMGDIDWDFASQLIADIINFPKPEGDDGGDEFNYDDYSNIQTQAQTLPVRNLFYLNFPKIGAGQMPARQVYELIGGTVLNSYNSNSNYRNACALRVSRALNLSGNTIPVFFNNVGDQRTQKGGDNKNYILDAASLLAYMKKTFPNSPPLHLVNKSAVEIKKALAGKWGIYIMVPKNRASFGSSGHADFWSQTECLSGSYADKAKEVYFWELF